MNLVCKLLLSKDEVSQKELKDMVGFELKQYCNSYSMEFPPEESDRCWTLKYKDEASFHIDILPSVPDDEGFLNHSYLKSMVCLNRC